MIDHPTALRLADALDAHQFDEPHAAAAELRRLHAENGSLRQIVEDFPPIEAELQEVSDRAHRAEAQRDALLEALKHCSHINGFREFNDYLPTIRAAIKAAEENT